MDATTQSRPVRADVRRNREALVASAADAFAARGPDAPLEEIARAAGVGIATLYRHFPTREALIEAVYRREVELLTGGVDELLDALPGDEALAEWMRRFIARVAGRRGMSAALKSALGPESEVFAAAKAQILAATERLVRAAVAQGRIDPHADAADVLRGLGSLCTAPEAPDRQERALRLADLLVDGLRYRAPGP